jgi:hypothetical protein
MDPTDRLFSNIKSFFQTNEPPVELVAQVHKKLKPQNIPKEIDLPPKTRSHGDLDALILAIKTLGEDDESDPNQTSTRKITMKQFLEG